jgi:ribonuclease Y
MAFASFYVEGAALLMGGVALGFWLLRWKDRQRRTSLEQQHAATLENARREADAITREARLAANEEALKLREQVDKSLTARQEEAHRRESQLAQRENLINQQLEGLVRQENHVREREQTCQKLQEKLEAGQCEVVALDHRRRDELARLAQLSPVEARALLLKEEEQAALKDANDLSRHILDEAKARAEDQAKRIISVAIQRYASEHTFETTTATINLNGDELKGRIIGREGRNIRAFEAATGVTVLIDDTPNAVVLSGFDPVRRAIAKEAMERLILDGRIHPTRIEEVVSRVEQEMDEAIQRAGEEAVLKVGLPPMNAEIVKQLGRLKFRQSFSQNILDHSIEVAHLMSLMAAELRLDISSAKRAGLLHDIGKAMNHEVEGSHAMIGADFIQRYGESPDVVNGVASHHDEVPHTCPLGILVSAADAISASRPGARSESMSIYLKRLDHLEKIGLSFPGVEKCYAVQAGRELRVMVRPEELGDEQAGALARNITRKIEDELQYPGQIRVTVIRETRVIEYAK